MEERRTLYRWFWAWDFEREEAWLNELAESGWALDGVGFCTYHFIRCEPGEYTVRLELHGPDDDYLRFMGETGAEYVGRMVKWVYFRKKTADGPFDLFSDIDSRVRHLDRIGRMFLVAGAANLTVGLVNTFNRVGFGWINLLCVALLTYGLGRIHERREALRRARLLHE